MDNHRSYLYLLSFLEGASVMSCELIGAKLLAPYFGTSLYVWAAALGLTLGGLMLGYFSGGLASKRWAGNVKLLFSVLIMAGFFLAIMPFTSHYVMKATLFMNLQTGAMLSLLVFMVPPLLFMGMTSPIIINLLTRQAQDAGSSAGSVYAISTLGGIGATFLLGFYIIPTFGITQPAVINGILLALLPTASLLRRSNWQQAVPAILLLVSMVYLSFQPVQSANAAVLYKSEGVLGQVKVVDFPIYGNNQPDKSGRALIVNRTMQTVMDLSDPTIDYWQYTHYIPEIASFLPTNSKALLLGMGGGTLVRRLLNKGLDVEAVEIDERIKEVAIRFFNLPPEQEVIVDDARHYLKVTPNTYDLIIFDTFKGESAPEHVITLEGLQDAKQKLSKDGLILVNFYGYLDGSLGLLTRSVYKTLSTAGFNTIVLATPGTPDTRNIVLLAYQDQLPASLDALRNKSLNVVQNIDTNDALLLTDEQPRLHLYARAAVQWRKLYNKYFVEQFD
ncbi:MAG: fused MFS/spermidine synthase [Saprospiraceae bacterium]